MCIYVCSRTFDYEVPQDRIHILRVCITDNGAPSITVCRNLRITVEDVNDNAPVFRPSNEYVIDVYENTPIQTVLLRVVTTDLDTPEFSVVEYSVILDTVNPTEDDARSFVVNPTTGEVKSLLVFDRETKDFYQFPILARNGALTTRANVTLNILDRNDHIPVVFQPSLFAMLRENATKDTMVGRIVVVDNDIGPNMNISFKLTLGDDGDLGHFAIDRNGRVYVREALLDYETKTIYMINVSLYTSYSGTSYFYKIRSL